MRQGLSLKVSQHLTLTPQLQQSIRLLQLSTLELAQEVEQMLDDNPFLERDDSAAPREAFGLDAADTPAQGDDPPEGGETAFATTSIAAVPDGTGAATSNDPETSAPDEPAAHEPGWDGDGTVEMAPDDGEWGGEALARGNNLGTGDGGERADAAELARAPESLQAFLHRQALSLRLDETDRAALYFLIESLNDDGWLEDSLPALASTLAGADDDAFDELVHRFTVALALLQSLEPVGVGARDLGECLAIQLRALAPGAAAADGRGGAAADATPEAARLTALAICRQPLELLARRDVRRLAALTRTGEEQVRAALQLIARLEPRPGRRFADVERNVVVPDVIVTRATGRAGQADFRVQINPDVLPRLRVHDLYAGALKAHKGEEAAQALGARLQEARWFIRNIQQRFDTILRVATAIVERQKSFFLHGELAMRPLVLREIADELGLHESTISRVTSAKYLATPYGTFELKYFFGSALGTEAGGNASSTAVRALIKQFVAAENPVRPLSDSQLAAMLHEQGIECARRTVAKYREALKIAPTHLRKTL